MTHFLICSLLEVYPGALRRWDDRWQLSPTLLREGGLVKSPVRLLPFLTLLFLQSGKRSTGPSHMRSAHTMVDLHRVRMYIGRPIGKDHLVPEKGSLNQCTLSDI